MKMKIIFPAILFMLLPALPVPASDDLKSEEQVYTRIVSEPELKSGPRRRTAGEVLIFPECQYKYSLFQNFLGDFVDRPLFFNRAWRTEKFEYMNAPAFLKDIEIMKSYGMNGSGNIASASFRIKHNL